MDFKYINMDYLDSVSGGDPDIILEILNMFKEQSVEILEEMRSFLSEGNFPSLGLLAHKAKSSVSIMGMNDLAQMLKTFELQAKEGKDSELYETYVERFGSDTKEAVKELEIIIAERLKIG